MMELTATKFKKIKEFHIQLVQAQLDSDHQRPVGQSLQEVLFKTKITIRLNHQTKSCRKLDMLF
jgi:hypothetical protein